MRSIETLLVVHELREALGDGLHQSDLAVPACLLVGHIEPVVNERAEEISLAELQHLHRCLLKNVSVISCFLQDLIV